MIVVLHHFTSQYGKGLWNARGCCWMAAPTRTHGIRYVWQSMSKRLHSVNCMVTLPRAHLFALAVRAYSTHVCMRIRGVTLRAAVGGRVAKAAESLEQG